MSGRRINADQGAVNSYPGGPRALAAELGVKPRRNSTQIRYDDVLDAVVDLCRERLAAARGARVVVITKEPTA